MYVRKKPYRSGSTSVVVIKKRDGKSCYLKTIGVSSDEKEIEELYLLGKKWISEQHGQRDIFFEHTRVQEEKDVVEHLLSNVEQILINGTQLILNSAFQTVGFDKINDDILKHLVVSRICQPQSKVATVDYLKSYFDEDVELHKIYRYLDKLSDTQKDIIQKIIVEHTRKVLGGKIGVVFYDVTTLYFETDFADDFRKTGFLILGNSEQRAKKDAYNREKGVRRLEKEYKSGAITKDKINK